MEKIKRILIVAGEASGDMHAASLVRNIKRINPQTEFFGAGGRLLAAEGVRLLSDLVSIAVLGISEVLKNYPKFKSAFNGLLAEAEKKRPDLAILVDYPGFNLRLAVQLAKRGIPVVYYISPQVWAWGKKRIATIRRVVKLVIVVFKFEEELYRKEKVPVFFCGHPLLDITRADPEKEEKLRELGIGKKVIALLPGSREKEVKSLLPIMLEAAKIINRSLPEYSYLILRSETVDEKIFKRMLEDCRLPVKIATGMVYEGLKAADFALVASGTATLETAIMGVPMAILYKVSFFTWAFAKMVIRIPYIGLANLVSGKMLVPEFIQQAARPDWIAGYVTKILNDPQELARIRTELSKTSGLLGNKGASERAAAEIVKLLRQPSLS